MACDHHSHAFGDACPYEVPRCCASEVVYEASRLSYPATRAVPGRPKIPDRFPMTMEDPRDNSSALTFQNAGFLALVP